jgi:DNA-directed RNA polymerase specialized sigma24 family protein
LLIEYGLNLKIGNTNYVNYLIETSKGGSKRAFFDLCEINLKNIFTISYRLLADYNSTKKITLDTFLGAWDNFKDYDSNVPFAIWIKNLAIRYSINKLRSTSFQIPAVKEKSNYNSESEYLENLIMALQIDERIIFVLHDLEGYSYKEINCFFEGLEIDEIKTKLINTREYLMSKISI